jgi:hypothetical protein
VTAALFAVTARILEMRPSALLRVFAPGVGAGVCAAAVIGATGLLGTRGGLPVLLILLVQIALGLVVAAIWLLKARHGAAWRETRLRLFGSRSDPVDGRYSRLVRWLDGQAGPDSV